MVTVQQGQETALEEQIGVLWTQVHGCKPGRVRMHTGMNRVVIWIENVLTPGEQISARKAIQALTLQQSLEELAGSIQIEVCRAIESLMHCPVATDGVQADVDKGWIMCSYRLFNQAYLF